MTAAKSADLINLAVLISGGGTTLSNLLQKIDAGALRARIRVVVSSSSRARGLQFAERAGIPVVVAAPADYAGGEAFSEAIFQACRAHEAQLVVMGGFIKHLLIPGDFENRVMNIHPGLIPSFCGKGFYGSRVHQAVLDYGAKLSGCTVHFVDNEYDNGPIILQRGVPVYDNDTAETLQQRVFEQECLAYPEAIQLYGDGRLTVVGRHVRIAP